MRIRPVQDDDGGQDWSDEGIRGNVRNVVRGLSDPTQWEICATANYYLTGEALSGLRRPCVLVKSGRDQNRFSCDTAQHARKDHIVERRDEVPIK